MGHYGLKSLMNGSDSRSGRDARLLALVIIVSLAVLLVLARFRFPPSVGAPATPVPGPLERLTARSTYDDLAGSVANVVLRVSGSVLIVQLNAVPEPEKPGAAKGRTPAPEPPPVARAAAARGGASGRTGLGGRPCAAGLGAQRDSRPERADRHRRLGSAP